MKLQVETTEMVSEMSYFYTLESGESETKELEQPKNVHKSSNVTLNFFGETSKGWAFFLSLTQ